MINKKKTLKDQSQEVADSLDAFISDDTVDMDNTEGLPSMRPVEDNDYTIIKTRAQKRAAKAIDQLMSFYLTAEIIEQEKYLKIKAEIDKLTLSSLMFQLEAGEMALTTLLKTIDSGELAPRMFEVLATLQKSMLEIIKSQTLYLMAAEEGTKKLSRDLEVYKGKMLQGKEEPKQVEGHVHRGTKNLMKDIQGSIDSEFEEIKEDN